MDFVQDSLNGPIDHHLLGVRGKAALDFVVGKTLEATWDACKSAYLDKSAGGSAVAALPEELKTFESALLHPDSLAGRAKAQLKWTNRRGVLLVGPSGAGKSMIYPSLVGGTYAGGPTTEPIQGTTRLGSRIVTVRDTIGDPYQDKFGTETRAAIITGVDVIVLVVANGYLDTPDLPLRTRPGQSTASADLRTYRARCLREEIDWLSAILRRLPSLKPARRAQALVVLANKVELWGGGAAVRSHYLGPKSKFNGELKKLARLVLTPQAAGAPYYAECSAEFGSFRHGDGVPAIPEMPVQGSPAGSRTSMQMLRATLELLLAYA